MKQPKRVAIIAADSPAWEKYCPNWTGMLDGLETLGIERRLFSCRKDFSIEEIIAFQPELVVYGLLDIIRMKGARLELKKRLPSGTRFVVWYGDLRDERTGFEGYDLSEIDAMFISNDGQRDLYKRIWQAPEVFYLPLGSSIVKTEYKPQLAFDFVFIGSVSTRPGFGDRAWQIDRLVQEAGLKRINGPTSNPELRAKVFKEMPNIYHSSKVCLDMSHFTDVHRYTSNRHWIIPASDAFALTKRFPGCELDYPEGTRVYFDTIDECIEKTRYYIEHDDERLKIQAAGLVHAENHTYDKRFLRMFDILYG